MPRVCSSISPPFNSNLSLSASARLAEGRALTLSNQRFRCGNCSQVILPQSAKSRHAAAGCAL
jgi:hypothetical protein